MAYVIDLGYLKEIRDITDSADDNKVIDAYKYYKTKEKELRKLDKKETYFLKCLEKEIKERNITL